MNTFPIIMLDFHETPTTKAQANQVLQSLVAKLCPEYRGVPLSIRVHRIETAGESNPVALADRVGFTPEEWRQLPIIPRLPSTNALPLWREINERRGYAYPIVRSKPGDGSEWDSAETMEDVAKLL